MIAKGVTINTDTKPNEKMHGPSKVTYNRLTNYKEVAGTVSKIYTVIMCVARILNI